MPAKHKYKCLNPNCSGPGNRSHTDLFSAMNSPMPECPSCGGRRLEDWGECVEREGWIRITTAGPTNFDTVKRSDNNLRRVADRYGLTDMNNKDGQAVKRSPTPSAAPGPMVNVGGYQVPASVAASGGCMTIPGIGVPMKTEINKAEVKSSPMMKRMTRVVAEHKANA